MPLTVVRQEVAARFLEAQSFLTSVKNDEGSTASKTQEVNTRKGLFIVLLYSSLEYAVSRSVIEYAQTINLTKVQHYHIDCNLYSLTLDAELTSCAMSGKERRWQKRKELFVRQRSSEVVVISESAFLEQLENVWAKTILKVFSVLGIPGDALYDVRVGQYINEVVERRNAVAHGRESAAVVGQSYTMGKLQTLLDEISKEAQYIMARLEQHLDGKHFIREKYKSDY